MTCAENVALPLRKHKACAPARRWPRRGAASCRSTAGLGDRFRRSSADGMRKRVAIARALTLDPRYVLFDERRPASTPERAPRGQAHRELSDTLGVTSIVVSHDLVSIFSIATGS